MSSAYHCRLIASRNAAPIAPTTVCVDDCAYTFDGVAVCVPARAPLPERVRIRFASVDQVAVFTRSPAFDAWDMVHCTKVQQITDWMYSKLLGMGLDDVAPMCRIVPSMKTGRDFALFPLFVNGHRYLSPEQVERALRFDQRPPTLLARLSALLNIMAFEEASLMLAGTIVHCTQTSNFYRVDAICSDLTVANLTFLKNVANTRQVVAKHCHTSSGEDVLQAPRFLVPELCHDMRVKADVMNYAFAFLHLVPHLRHLCRVEALLHTLKIGSSYTESFRRALIHRSVKLSSCYVRLHNYSELRQRCDFVWDTSGPVSFEWSRFVDEPVSTEDPNSNPQGLEFYRQSFLGSAVLGLVVNSHLFALFSHDDEGELSIKRSRLLTFKQFIRWAKDLDLNRAILSSSPGFLDILPDSVAASAVTTVFGCVFSCIGLAECRRMLSMLLFSGSELEQNAWNAARIDERTVTADLQPLSPSRRQQLAELKEKLSIEFLQDHLLDQALGGWHQQRLELLGDSVLQLIVSQLLIDGFPELEERTLTLVRSGLVKNEHLHRIALDHGLLEYLVRKANSDQIKLIADAVEAIIGAVYLGSNLARCRSFICQHIFKDIDDILDQDDIDLLCPKNQLQQHFQALTRESNAAPVYDVVERTGPDHDVSFKVHVLFKNELIGEGSGSSKRQAEKRAAMSALNRIRAHVPVNTTS
ncbi:ribonuclease III [Plasmodiophora brassicae]|uniref:Uncharacterized protein n=2 Tax=Plasmodiophora brassicae TaxID=37360 RepID=A0A3P3YAZ5_PLABS|nr:unnamed protein product [Plasmodiophora brassicae]